MLEFIEVLDKNPAEAYIEVCNGLCKAFDDKYYESYGFDEITHSDTHIGPICFGDEYWNLDDIFIALKHNIDKKVLFDWYNSVQENYGTNKYVNLFSYNLGK